jgi:hypothetical protein
MYGWFLVQVLAYRLRYQSSSNKIHSLDSPTSEMHCMYVPDCVGRDHAVYVGRDHTVYVGRDDTVCVGRDHTVYVGRDHKVCVGIDHTN